MHPTRWCNPLGRWAVSLLRSLLAQLQVMVRAFMIWVISAGPIPSHIAFIMDGNRRFADRLHIDRHIGHSHGYDALLCTLKDCFDLHVKTVTLYAFSIDNFQRPPEEVSALMDLMQTKLESLVEKEGLAREYGIRVRILGDLSLLPPGARIAAEKAMAVTSENSSAFLNLCISYTSTHEIVHSIQRTRDNFLSALCKNHVDDRCSLTGCCFKEVDVLRVGNACKHACGTCKAGDDGEWSGDYVDRNDVDSGDHIDTNGFTHQWLDKSATSDHVVLHGYCRTRHEGDDSLSVNGNFISLNGHDHVDNGYMDCDRNGATAKWSAYMRSHGRNCNVWDTESFSSGTNDNRVTNNDHGRRSRLQITQPNGLQIRRKAGAANNLETNKVCESYTEVSQALCSNKHVGCDDNFEGRLKRATKSNGFMTKDMGQKSMGSIEVANGHKHWSGLARDSCLGNGLLNNLCHFNGSSASSLNSSCLLEVSCKGSDVNGVPGWKFSEGDRDLKLLEEHVSQEEIEKHLYTYPCSPPDILIRTSGETRLSNFLLWQASFSHLAFCRVLWPEFSLRHLLWIIIEYQRAFPALLRKRQLT